jgi:hypothetical protein
MADYFIQALTFDEVGIINALRNSDEKFMATLLKRDQWSPTAITVACTKVKDEIIKYSSDLGSLLYCVDAYQLSNLSLPSLTHEFVKKIPTLVELLSTFVSHRESDLTLQTNKEHLSTVLACHNQKLPAVRYINGIILQKGGATDTCVTRLAATRDTVTPPTLRIKLDHMSCETKNVIKDWDKPRVNSCIVFDDVNPFAKPRHQSTTKTNKLYSMTPERESPY